jgi:hypothetical protein
MVVTADRFLGGACDGKLITDEESISIYIEAPCNIDGCFACFFCSCEWAIGSVKAAER